MSEGENIGWEYTLGDVAEQERIERGELTEFELMLDYHGMSEQEFFDESGNEQGRLWCFDARNENRLRPR